jgi:hypothetical protein
MMLLTSYTPYTAHYTAGNPSTTQRLPSISNINKVCKNSSEEDAIIIAQSKIACLDNISLKGEIPPKPDNILDTAA